LDARSTEDALKYSDKAMYQAKGRNTIQFFTLEMQSEAEQRLVLENELCRAIDQGELDLHYQPIVDVKWALRERGNSAEIQAARRSKSYEIFSTASGFGWMGVTH